MLTIADRVNIRYVRHENGYSRIKYDLMCECGCDSKPFMEVVYKPNLTNAQAKKLIIKKHEV